MTTSARITWTETYASSTFTVTSSEAVVTETENLFDNLGDVYESDVYNVDPTNGTVGDYLPTYYWHDADGNVIETETGTTGAFTKTQYDGLDRPVVEYTGYDTSETPETAGTWAAADVVDSTDTIVQQTQTWYDQAGEPVATATYERLPNDTTTAGALDATDSYAITAVTWYDGIGRTVATANYGREDVRSGVTHYFFDGTSGSLIDTNSDGIPDVAEAAPPQPYTSQNPSSLAGIDFQLQLTEYDSAGRPYETIDNLDRINETLYDNAGRALRTIQNYTSPSDFTNGSPLPPGEGMGEGGIPLDTDIDHDITVDYQYDSGGRLATMTAYDANGSTVTPETTTYLYGSAVNASWQAGVVYPDSAASNSQTIAAGNLTRSGTTATVTLTNHGYNTGDWVCISGANETDFDGWVQVTRVDANTFTYTVPSGTVTTASGNIQVRGFASNQDVTTTDYDRLGRVVVASDQRGVTHKYVYDAAGRLSADVVTSLGPSGVVHGSVRAIGTTYDDVGRVRTVTSYSDTAETEVVNQVKDAYDGWGNLKQEWQSVSGPVDTGSTPSVQYAYDDGYSTSGSDRPAPYLRLSRTIYPNGRDVQYGYGTTGAIDDIMSRLESIGDNSGTFATFNYLGAGTIAVEDFVQAQVKLDYNPGNDGSLTGFDRFGRIADQLWEHYHLSGGNEVVDGTVDEYTYTYDRAGNVHSRLNDTKTNGSLDEVYGYNDVDELISVARGGSAFQSWTLDSLGNWLNFTDGSDNGHQDLQRRQRGDRFHGLCHFGLRRGRQRHDGGGAE